MQILEEYSKTLDSEEQTSFAKNLQDKMNTLQEEIWKETQKTVVQRISINNGKIKYEAEGEVSGSVLNQFSMGEYEGVLRISTTTGYAWGSTPTSANHVFCLKSGTQGLDVIGKLENLAVVFDAGSELPDRDARDLVPHDVFRFAAVDLHAV